MKWNWWEIAKMAVFGAIVVGGSAASGKWWLVAIASAVNALMYGLGEGLSQVSTALARDAREPADKVSK